MRARSKKLPMFVAEDWHLNIYGSRLQ
jgi:hypothetical protein